MKKYLTIGISLLLIVMIYNVLSIYTGIYIKLNKNSEINKRVYVENKKIYLNDSKEPIQIKGVSLSSSYPGYNFSDYKVEKNKYLEWLNEIQEMGANTIKTNNRLNPDFYEALNEYNTEHEEKPLYLIQGVEIEEYETNNSKSIYGYKEEIIKECLLAVDVIHGNRYVLTSGISGRGLYNKDVSKWTLGYSIGNIGKEETIAYTDNTDKRNFGKEYNGKYFYTINASSETENIIAEIMDKMMQYETSKYNEQRLISITIDMLRDPFKYKENVNVQLGEMAYINMNNIKEKEKLKSEKIISYDMVGGINHFVELLDEEEIEENKEILSTLNTNAVYGGYVEFINKYYESPVIISNYGFSTSRVIDKEYEKTINEKEQGEKIVDYYYEFVKSGCCGAIISSWQDNWALTNWNVKYSTAEEKEIYWFNKNAIDQCYGILTFEAKDRENICYVDGDINEWNEENIISKQNDVELYCKYDFENMYIMLKNIDTDKTIYIPVDTTQKSGASKYMDTNFARNTDFLIKIDGKENSEVLVQEYYDSTRAMYEENITGIRQYSNIPDKNTEIFNSIRTILRKKVDPTVDISRMTAMQRQKYRLYKVDNAGKLVFGNGNPNNSEYNSLTDYCFGKNCVEIQIPWQLLNFSAPNEMLIHGDYYKNYGVENEKIDELYMGVGYSGDTIEFGSVELERWNKKVEVRERLKKSYDIIKKAWSD